MACGQELALKLRQHGFRVTPQRAVILEIIAHCEGHCSAREVFQAARHRLPGLNIATVYRTLDSLHRVGILDLFSADGGTIRFSLHDPSHPHYHLLCLNCDHEFEYQSDCLELLAQELRSETGFQLATNHMTMTGYCAECEGERPGAGGDAAEGHLS